MPLLWISLSFLAGIVLAASIPLPAWAWAFIAIVFLLLFIFLRRRFSNTPFHFQLTTFHFSLATFHFLLPTILFLGAAYFQARQPNIDAFHIAFYNDRNYQLLITGSLAEPPDYRDKYTNLTLDVEAVDTGDGDLQASGRLLVRVLPNEEYQ